MKLTRHSDVRFEDWRKAPPREFTAEERAAIAAKDARTRKKRPAAISQPAGQDCA